MEKKDSHLEYSKLIAKTVTKTFDEDDEIEKVNPEATLGGHWPEDGHWPKEWYAIEREMNRSGDVASSGGGGYENEKNEGGDLGTP